MGLRDKYRAGWAADRYTTRTWRILAAWYGFSLVLGIVLAVIDFPPIVRLFGVVLALVMVTPLIVSLRQAPRSTKA